MPIRYLKFASNQPISSYVLDYNDIQVINWTVPMDIAVYGIFNGTRMRLSTFRAVITKSISVGTLILGPIMCSTDEDFMREILHWAIVNDHFDAFKRVYGYKLMRLSGEFIEKITSITGDLSEE